MTCSHINISSSIPQVPPGPPKDLHHTDVDKTEVWLAWNWPDRNGGSGITGFLVEFQEEGEKEWDEWKTVSIPESHVTGLEEGKTYRFRVRAENAIGLSRPDTTLPILCQEKLGELHFHFGEERPYNIQGTLPCVVGRITTCVCPQFLLLSRWMLSSLKASS